LNRCSPRSRSARVMANGKRLASWPPILPVVSSSSAFSNPRATVPSTSGCDDAPPGNVALASSGSYRGASCMSWRQPATPATTRPMATRRPTCLLLLVNGHHLARVEPAQERARLVGVEPGIARLDGEKEPVLAG